jgi:Xaa-Pro aminopeptidase
MIKLLLTGRVQLYFTFARSSTPIFPLERLRARKTKAELTLLREASERIVASMLAVFNGCCAGPNET